MLNEFALLDALAHSDFPRAKTVVQHWLTDPRGTHFTPLNLAYISQYAARSGDWQIRDLVVEHASGLKLNPQDGIGYREGFALIGLHLGIAFLHDPDKARAWLTKALLAVPDLLPARVELALLDGGLDRNDIMKSLGEELPTLAWRYELAAAQLGLASDLAPASVMKAGIALRGMSNEATPALARLYRRAIGDRPLLLATWDDTDPDVLHALRGICDQVLTVADPPEPGFQNRARQILLAQTVLDAAAGQCDLALLTRTDIALFRPDPLAALTALWHHFPCVDKRLHGRLIVSQLYTRRYTPDHPSDLIMFGATDDLQLYWASPPCGKAEHSTFIEQYLSRNFRAELNMPPHNTDLTPRQYMEYLRDYFVVRDMAWFEGWWVGRRNDLRAATHLAHFSNLVTQAVWEDLYYANRTGQSWSPNIQGALLGGLFPRRIP